MTKIINALVGNSIRIILLVSFGIVFTFLVLASDRDISLEWQLPPEVWGRIDSDDSSVACGSGAIPTELTPCA